MNQSIATAFSNMAGSFPGVITLIYGGFWLAGLVCVAWGVNNLRYATDHQRSGGTSAPTASLISIVVGAVLCYMPTMLASVAQSVFENTSPAGLMDYEDISACSGTYAGIRSFVQIVGIYFFGRGWLSLRHVGIHGDSSKHTFYGGVVRIFSGIALVHIIDTLVVLSNTLGLGVVQSWLTNLSTC